MEAILLAWWSVTSTLGKELFRGDRSIRVNDCSIRVSRSWFYFYANYALKLHQNAGIMLNSFTPSLFPKLFGHNSRIPINFHTLTKRKEKKRKRKKNEEIKPIFESLYLGNTLCDLVEMWNVEYWRWRESPQQKIVWFRTSSRKLYAYMKIALLYFLSI